MGAIPPGYADAGKSVPLARHAPGLPIVNHQARDLFLHFFPPTKKLAADAPPPDPTSSEKAPLSDEADRLALADGFAALVPDGRYSVAALQGFLMTHKGDPAGAVATFPAWTPPSASKAGTPPRWVGR